MYADNDDLIVKFRNGHDNLRWVIVENNKGLVNEVLKGFKWAYNNHPLYEDVITYDDLYQEGLIGLSKALDTYNPELGAFSTHAFFWISQAIYRSYYNTSLVIRVPGEPRSRYTKLRRAEQQYIMEYQKEPSLKELSIYARMSTDDILELRRMFSVVISIDQPISGNEDEDITLQGIIQDETDFFTDIERELTLKELRKDLEKMAKIAVKNEDHIRVLFYYFDNLGKKTVQDMAEILGYTRGPMNRVINDSIRKINQRFLDELIEKYSDLFSSCIRRLREQDLRKTSVRYSIPLVASKMLSSGDSITLYIKDFRKKSPVMVHATIRDVEDGGINVKYIDRNRLTGEFQEETKYIAFQWIEDFRTQNKKIVELVTENVMNPFPRVTSRDLGC